MDHLLSREKEKAVVGNVSLEKKWSICLVFRDWGERSLKSE
jgi:hypothetical protein